MPPYDVRGPQRFGVLLEELPGFIVLGNYDSMSRMGSDDEQGILLHGFLVPLWDFERLNSVVKFPGRNMSKVQNPIPPLHGSSPSRGKGRLMVVPLTLQRISHCQTEAHATRVVQKSATEARDRFCAISRGTSKGCVHNKGNLRHDYRL